MKFAVIAIIAVAMVACAGCIGGVFQEPIVGHWTANEGTMMIQYDFYADGTGVAHISSVMTSMEASAPASWKKEADGTYTLFGADGIDYPANHGYVVSSNGKTMEIPNSFVGMQLIKDVKVE